MTTTISNQKLLILNTYIPPYKVLGSLIEVSKIVKKLQKLQPNALMMIVGDFNLLKTKWITEKETNLLIPDIGNTRQIELTFIEEINKWGLQQIQNIPNSQGSFLDLVFTNDMSQTTMSDTPPIDWMYRASHHHNPYSITIINDNTDTTNKISKTKRNYNKMNMKNVRNVIDNTIIFNYSNEEAMFEEHNDKTGIIFRINSYLKFITNCQNKNAPLMKTIKKNEHPWELSKEYVRMKTLAKRLYKNYRRQSTEASKKAYQLAKIKCIKEYNSNKTKYYSKIIENSNGTPFEFYKLIKKRNKNVSTLPFKLTTKDGVFTGNDRFTKLAESLSKNFGSPTINFENIHTSLNNQLQNLYNINYNDNNVHLWTDFKANVSIEEIKEYISQINNKKNPGPMNIQPRLLKEGDDNINNSMLNIINAIIDTTNIPKSWKKSYLIPIPKPGDREKVENYRGIAIQSILPKILDRIITTKLYNVLNTEIDENQHGFCKGKGTVTNLAEYTYDIYELRKQRKTIDSIYSISPKRSTELITELWPKY